MRVKRIDQLEQYIIEHNSVSIDKLCDIFQISKNTLRRDLNVIVQKGTIKKVYGGVISTQISSNIHKLTSFNERTVKNNEAKNRIVFCAAKYIKENDIIFIDTGTTTLHLVDYIKHLSNLTIITNSIQVMYQSLSYPNLSVIGLPGVLNQDTASLVGSGCIEYLKNYNIDKCFMACTALSLDTGICNASNEEYEIKKTVLEKSKIHYLLADYSKFDTTSLMTYCPLSEIDYIITDQEPKKTYYDFCKTYHIKIEVALKQPNNEI